MEDKIICLIIKICRTEEVKDMPDLDLFDSGLLDSLGLVALLVAIEEEFDVTIAPTELERDDINTVNKIIRQIVDRVKNA